MQPTTIQPLIKPSLMGNILLVQSNTVEQQQLTFDIQQTGAQVELAKNGVEGLKKALTSQCNLILMDIQMPIMGGIEAMRALQQLGVSAPTYALTVDGIDSDTEEYKAIGFMDTLSKPIKLEILYPVLCQHLSICDGKDNAEEQNTQKSQLFIPNLKIRALFYKELTKQYIEINQDIQNLNYAGLTKVTHIIKGSAGSFGYDDLTNLAAQSLLLLRQKQYINGIQHCIMLNQKVAEVLNEHNN